MDKITCTVVERIGIGILLIVLVLLISGCSEQLDRWAINKAIEECKSNGGVDYITVNEDGLEYVMCQNSFGTFIKKKAKPF